MLRSQIVAPDVANDDRSVDNRGDTISSSLTSGDYDRRTKVVGLSLIDPFGDRGTYSGVVLRSTGMPHGVGRMVYEADGRTLEGDWRHGRWHGYGRATFPNNDTYEGEYRFDQRHGRGKYCWADGRSYDGDFVEDKRHGKGRFEWPDGATYTGDFFRGQREGHGKYTFSDGGYYAGGWVDGQYEGFGGMFVLYGHLLDIRLCSCHFHACMMPCRCVVMLLMFLTNASYYCADSYHSIYVLSSLEFHYADGRSYKGEWKAGMAHGQGVETNSDGSVRHNGQWTRNEPVLH